MVGTRVAVKHDRYLHHNNFKLSYWHEFVLRAHDIGQSEKLLHDSNNIEMGTSKALAMPPHSESDGQIVVKKRCMNIDGWITLRIWSVYYMMKKL